MVTKSGEKSVKPKPTTPMVERKSAPRTFSAPGKLSDMAVRSMKTKGFYSDGGNLWLRVTASGAKSWAFIYTVNKRTREMGLGDYPTFSLGSIDDDTATTARGQARGARQLIRAGKDPIEARQAELGEGMRTRSKLITFAEAASKYIAEKESAWKHEKSAAQWRGSLDTYAMPTLGPLLVSGIDLGHVLAVLKPIWTTKTETATRVRGRIESVLDWATVHKYRSGDNPARWRGNLDKAGLTAPGKIKNVEHFAALEPDAMPTFMKELRERESISARALEFTVLCAVRTSETIGATWAEVDLDAKTWTIPKERMKGRKEHRVPLSGRAVETLSNMGHREGFLFPGAKEGKGLSSAAMTELLKGMQPGYTVHGMRSTFRDWCSERTNFPHEVCEMALAHTINSKAEAAYRRGDLFVKRAKLMDQWASFCAKEWLNVTGTSFVLVPLVRKAKAVA